MNWNRVVVGGLVSGLVLNLGEFAIEPLMGPQMENFLRRLSLPVPTEGAMLALAAFAMVLGVVSVWLYAALTSRFGAGMRTAAVTGVLVWVLSCFFPNITIYFIGLFDAKMFWYASVWPLIETVLATMAGAKVYREGPVAPPAPVAS